MAKQFVSFIVAGGIAAGVNLASRWALNHIIGFEFAVALAYVFGMSTSFVLARHFVFERSNSHWPVEYLRFALVNVMSFLMVIGVSIGLARYGFPAIGLYWHAHDIAHLIGVISPIAASFYAHKHFSFSKS